MNRPLDPNVIALTIVAPLREKHSENENVSRLIRNKNIFLNNWEDLPLQNQKMSTFAKVKF